MDTTAKHIATEDGQPLEQPNRIWKERGNPIPMSSLSPKELTNNIEKVDQWIAKHRAQIVSHQQSILTLLGVKGELGAEARERGIELVVPQFETTTS